MNNTALKIENSTVETTKDVLYTNSINNTFIIGFQLWRFRVKMRLRLLKLIVINYSSPIDWVKAYNYLKTMRKNILGIPKIHKLVHVNGKYYMGLYTSAWFSKDFDQFIYSLLNDFKPIKRPFNRFNMVFISVTSKCPLQCEHCYDYDQLNDKGTSNKANLEEIVNKFQSLGVGHIQFLGGEPLLESKAICETVKSSKTGTDFWITTSGFSLNKVKAEELKASGITGVIVSLDHYNAQKHNNFRNNKNAFNWALSAVKNAINAKLIVALSLCVTKDFLTKENLKNYMALAKEIGVSYVQFLEPKPVGHFNKKDVLLNKAQISILENFFITYNFSSLYNDYPIIIYPGYHQRKIGCMLAGKKSVYIDANGNINACPFCHKSYGKIIDDNFTRNLEKLASEGCIEY